MIKIIRKEDCVGCNACAQICSKSCIDMQEDKQGFLYPKVDLDKCIDCHLCEKVCPVISQGKSRRPLQSYAAKNKDLEIQKTSSSGGVFFALVEYVIIEKQGVVFGARFNDKWEVVHDYAETIEDAKAFKGSKYVQSRIGDNFKKVEEFLKAGRIVLFSGTPCQIAGLHLFLRRDWGAQLLAVDVVCHGVPSPLVWRKYIENFLHPSGAIAGKNSDLQSTQKAGDAYIVGVSFRDKRISWEKFGFAIHVVANQGDKNSDLQSTKSQNEEQLLLFETLDKNIYMQGFLNDFFLRPSCYVCPSKCGKSRSDITLADFWGIASFIDSQYDTNGVSLVLTNTHEGEKVMKSLSVKYHCADYHWALAGNPALEHSARKPYESSLFWHLWESNGINAIKITLKKKRGSFLRRVLRFASRKTIGCFKTLTC